MTKKDIFLNFEKEVDNSELLNIDFNSDDLLEIVTSNRDSFFGELFSGEKISFRTIFKDDYVSSLAKANVKVGKDEILRKKRYQKCDLINYIEEEKFKAKEITSTSLPLYQDLLLSDFQKKDDIYLSCGNLYYQRKESKIILSTPLLFFKVKVVKIVDVYYFYLSQSNIYFNLPLIDLIKNQYKIDLRYDSDIFDIASYYAFIEKSIKGTVFALEEAMYLLSTKIEKVNRIARLVEDKNNILFNEIFNSLEEEKTVEKSLDKLSRKYPSYAVKALDFVFSHSLTRIVEENRATNVLLYRVMNEYFLAGKNVLIIASSSKEKDRIKKELVSSLYDSYFTYKDICKPNVALYTLLDSLQKKKGYSLDATFSITAMELQEKIDKKKELDILLKSIQIPTDEDNYTIYKNYTTYHEKAKKIYDFNEFNEYTNTMYKADMSFLSALTNSSFFLSHPFSTHPFYGLNSERKEEEFSSIHDFLISFVEDIDKFEKSIEESEIKLSAWCDFNSIRDFDENKKHFELYSQYNGFPLDFFSIKENEEMHEQLTRLKECYRKESAMKLAINVSTSEEIWDLDFETILNNIKGAKEKETRRQIKKLLKLNTKANYESLIVLLDKYQENKQTIKEIIPLLESDFGFLIADVDGINSIENALNFIAMLKRHKILYDKISFQNEFTEKIFSSPEYLDEFKRNYYPELVRLRSVFERNLDDYHLIFNEDKFDYTQASFTEIKERLARKINADENQYLEYLSFSKSSDASSPLLRNALLEEEKEENILLNFKNDYLTSLYQFLLKMSMDNNNGINLLEEECTNRFALYKTLDESSNLLHIKINEEFDSLRKRNIINHNFIRTLRKLKDIYHKTRLFSVDKALKESEDLFYQLYPLEVRSIDEINFLSELKFDLVIVSSFDTKQDVGDLYSALRLAKKAIIYNSESLLPYLSKVPSLKLDMSDDLYALSAKYPKDLMESLKKSLKKEKVDLIQDKRLQEGLTIPYYFEFENKKFSVNIESQDYEEDSITSFLLPKDLYSNYGVISTNLYIIPYIVYDDLSSLSLFNDIKVKLEEESNIASSLDQLSYEQQRKIKYFQMLDTIDNSFEAYVPSDKISQKTSEGLLKKSSLNERPISNISVYDIANGILTYLSNFTFLSKDVLVKHLSRVVGTDEKDIDFRLLFAKATNILVQEDKIITEKSHFYLNRGPKI